MIHAQVRKALRARLATLSGLPTLNNIQQVALEGFEFVKTEGQTYLSERLLPGITDIASVSPAALLRSVGVYQINVYVPADKGTAQLDALAGGIMDHFPPGLQLSASGQTVTVRRTYRSIPYQEPGWLFSPVTVEWYADTVNTI